MAKTSVRVLAGSVGLRAVKAGELSVRREGAAKRFRYLNARNRPIRDPRVVARLERLAVPPTYKNVRYAQDPRAHLQAVGEDGNGRLQYVYHRDWTKVRERSKAKRLIMLSHLLPRIHRTLSSKLRNGGPTREFALAAAVELIATSAIRAGGEEAARTNRTRGAATLLKSNVERHGPRLTLTFRAKGGKPVKKELKSARLAKAIASLSALPGRRLFQYRDDEGAVHAIRAPDLNAFLKELAGASLSVKDFRTLCATAEVLKALSGKEPAASVAERKRQINTALKSAAERLENTVTVCRTSYVHPAIIKAFEAGDLMKKRNGNPEIAIASLVKA